MKNLKFFFLSLMIIVSASCTKDALLDPSGEINDNSDLLKSSQVKLKIAVISDIHYMDPSLLPENPESDIAFQTYLAKDPKLIALSDPIFRKVISELKKEKPDIVLIPGDLTKDGELICHKKVINLLHKLVDSKIKVFVVPGNHDINNPEAWNYRTSINAGTIQAEDFASMYGDFGYDDAIYRDVNSLSYICQPYRKLWILGIDACKYADNADIAVVGGSIKPETMVWIQEKMEEARDKNITVLAMMHHGILQHYYGQQELDPGYLVDEWPVKAATFMEAGIKLVFTGHYHANDISQMTIGNNTLSDVETGSLVTPPCPYRLMILDGNFIQIESEKVTCINYPFPRGINFMAYSNMFLSSHLDFYFNYILQNMYGIPVEQATVVAPFLRNGIMAHYAGDEKIKPDERKKLDQLAKAVPPESSFLIDAINSFWTDLPINDTQVHIKLK
jgi:predicted MPP superfamily phosphohydrolase